MKLETATESAARLKNLEEQAGESAVIQEEAMHLQKEGNDIQRENIRLQHNANALEERNIAMQTKIIRLTWALLILTGVLLLVALPPALKILLGKTL